MKKLLYLIGMTVTVTSCGMFWVYRELSEMPDMTWHQSNIQTFETEIKEEGDYDVYFLFRHVHGFPYKDLGIRVQMKTASSDETNEYMIPIIADNREYLGDGSGDIWDVEFPIAHRLHLDPGSVAFAVEHRMEKEDLQLVMETGIRIDKAEE